MSVDVITFGCRLNAYESEVIRRRRGLPGWRYGGRQHLRGDRGSGAAGEADHPQARARTPRCAHRGHRLRRADRAEVVRRHAESRPRDRQRGEARRDLATTRDVLGAAAFGTSREKRSAVNDIMSVRETAAHLVDGLDGRARAFVQVQNGCDHRCTFCIIPYGRGNSRSVPMGEVVGEVRRLCERGYREVVLTGVDLTSYGSNLPGSPKLGTLVKQILKHVPELARLRLSSIDSVEADRELIDAFANEPRLMPHLHLSLQAGDDLILKRMKRRHSRADAIAFCDQLRRLRPDMVFGADIIAGFPTETEAMFARSLDLVDDCGLTHLHVFPFSPRPGTPAAKMPQVARAVVKERARRLREKGAATLVRHLDGEIGRQRRVLMESDNIGRTEQFTPVRVTAAAATILEVAITGHDGRQLQAA